MDLAQNLRKFGFGLELYTTIAFANPDRNGGNIRIYSESSFSVALQLPSHPATLKYLMDAWIAGVILDGKKQVKCNNCMGNQISRQHVCITRAPQLLIIHMLRFTFENGTPGKKLQLV